MSILVIVESPNKVAKIQGYLGANYKVIPTYGHVCDLPHDEIGVKEDSFNPVYVTSESGKKTISYIKSLMSFESKIVFATDPDREGESIAFHVARLLNISPDKVMKADVYEITKEAVTLAVHNPRPLDMNLVKAQEARRVLDRLIGFKFSPKLSDLFGQSMAAGRVQSAVLKMMVDVEKKIKEFKKQKHYRAVLGMPEEWDVKWNTKPHLVNDEEYIFDIELATKAVIVNELTVTQVTSDDEIVEPPPPLTTAKLIKLCSIFFDYDPKQTMEIAQKLFDDGLITYHRTDSLRISDKAITEIRRYMTNSGIPLPEAPIVHNKVVKRSQEAHEAIRPTDVFNDAPNLTDEQANLYQLIHRQVIGSQCRMAHRTITRAKFIGDNGFSYYARGIVYHDRGFFLLLPELYMDKEDAFMPQLIEGDKLFPLKRRVQPIDTIPPKRFTYSSLVEALEDMGIGRPSTYATIFSTLIERHHYVEKIKNQKSLRPTTNGMLVVESLSSTHFVETDYTSKMEDQLDSISSGSGQYRTVLESASSVINEDLIRVSMPEDEALLRNVKRCPLCNSPMRKRTGAHGEFWGCTSYPNCKHTEQCVEDKKDGKKRAKK